MSEVDVPLHRASRDEVIAAVYTQTRRDDKLVSMAMRSHYHTQTANGQDGPGACSKLLPQQTKLVVALK